MKVPQPKTGTCSPAGQGTSLRKWGMLCHLVTRASCTPAPRCRRSPQGKGHDPVPEGRRQRSVVTAGRLRPCPHALSGFSASILYSWSSYSVAQFHIAGMWVAVVALPWDLPRGAAGGCPRAGAQCQGRFWKDSEDRSEGQPEKGSEPNMVVTMGTQGTPHGRQPKLLAGQVPPAQCPFQNTTPGRCLGCPSLC